MYIVNAITMLFEAPSEANCVYLKAITSSFSGRSANLHENPKRLGNCRNTLSYAVGGCKANWQLFCNVKLLNLPFNMGTVTKPDLQADQHLSKAQLYVNIPFHGKSNANSYKFNCASINFRRLNRNINLKQRKHIFKVCFQTQQHSNWNRLVKINFYSLLFWSDWLDAAPASHCSIKRIALIKSFERRKLCHNLNWPCCASPLLASPPAEHEFCVRKFINYLKLFLAAAFGIFIVINCS